MTASTDTGFLNMLSFDLSPRSRLYLSPNLESLILDATAIAELKTRRVTQILIVTERVDNGSLKHLAAQAKDNQLTARLFPIKVLYDFPALRELNAKFLELLGDGSVLLLCASSEETIGRKLAGSILISSGSSLAEAVARGREPEQTIEFLKRFGQKFLGEDVPTGLAPETVTRSGDSPSANVVKTVQEPATPEKGNNAAELATIDPVVSPPLLRPAAGGTSERFKERGVNATAKRVRFSIKLKLIGIISALIIVSLTAMIWIATAWFRSDTQGRVLEGNLQLAEALGLKIRIELSSMLRNAPLVFGSGQDFFSRNPSVLFVGSLVRSGQTLELTREAFNGERLVGTGLSQASLSAIANKLKPQLLPADAGSEVAINISPETNFPAVALAERTPGGILLIFVDASALQKDFAGPSGEESISRFYLVDSRGDVIAHPDENQVLARANLSSVPIVRKMLQSRILSEQTPYTDQKGIRRLAAYRKIEFGGLGVIAESIESRVLEAVYAIQYRNMLVLVIVLSISVATVYLFARTLTVPLVKLVGAARSIEQGHYELELKPTTSDELGLLTESFSDMARGLRERERIKDAFGKFVNKELAEQALRGEIKLGGERKRAAVFFSDLRGFTAMSEHMKPEEVVEYLNLYFTVMVRCINETHGVVDKFIGDAVMAHWGAVGGQGNHTVNAINAALMMRKALIEFNLSGDGIRPRAAMGCGINSGPVVAGQIGSPERLEFTVIGDTVNLASRIETLNKPFATDLLISQDTYIWSEDQFLVVPMPAIKVKGKEEPQSVYAVLGRRDDPTAPKTLEEMRARVGINAVGKESLPAVLEDTEEKKYEILGK